MGAARGGDSNRSALGARSAAASLALGALGLLLTCASARAADGANVTVGLGAYATQPHGALGASERPPPPTYRTGEALSRAVPTNQWYSSLVFQKWGYPLHAHPMTYRATERGFEIGLPERHALSPDAFQREVEYPHIAALTVSPTAFVPEDARVAGFADWMVKVRFGAPGGDPSLDVTVLHGSPFSYFDCATGDVRVTFASAPTIIVDPRSAGGDPRVLAVSVGGHGYALFGPTGGEWHVDADQQVTLHLPTGKGYFSVAGLPDTNPQTVRDFLAVAYAFPVDTRAEFAYDEAKSTVRTTYRVETVAREGSNRATFMGLYPHHWSALATPLDSHYRYDSVRGPIRLVASNEFTTTRAFRGVLPRWPGLADPSRRSAVDSLLNGDVAKSDDMFMHQMGHGTYWFGKALGAEAQLLGVAEAQGKTGDRDELLRALEHRLEGWLDGRHANYFFYDRTIGTLVGLPQEFESYRSMNDHHFHYGYWLMAAANVALRDPAWASREHWGGMVNAIAADIATDERGRADFPYLRNFDTYEGHSWASGTAIGGPVMMNGNNQESSSEAVNAWAGLVLWGAATGDRHLRDLGVYLYTSEVAAVNQYWFDLDHQVLGTDYGKPFAVQVFGGKFSYNTWWTEEPHQMYGINMLPFTPASTYLGTDPNYVRSIFAALPGEEQRYRRHGNIPSHPPPDDIWQDALAECQALADPTAALARWNKQGSVENGETRTHTLFWLSSLAEMGGPDFGVSADTTLYAVFKDPQGAVTHLAYNAGSTPLHVTFSDGTTLDVAPHSLGKAGSAGH